MTGEPHGEEGAAELAVRVRVLKKVSEVARREAIVAFPAAKRAAGHAARAFLKKFSEEYARERRRHGRRSKNIN
ncbi:MAG: hypothetical protein H0V83_14055 [Rubrobacter sp.]|nr:hypothetical protein [Rubrobacter sp.]